TVDGPVEAPQIAGSDRARRRRRRARAAVRSPALGLERRDQVVHPRLALLQLREPRLGAFRVLLHLRQVRRLPALEVGKTRGLLLLLRPILGDAALQANELYLLRLNLVVELVEAVHEPLVSKGEQMQILVARNKLSD